MVELETLKVIFESVGANKIVSDLTKIQSSIEKLNKSFEKNAESTKKYLNAYNDISKSQARLWDTISNNVNTHKKTIFKAYDKEIQKLEEIKKLRESIYSNGTGGSSTPDGFNGEKSGWKTGNLVSMILTGFKGIFNFRDFAEQKRQETYRRYNQEQLIGSRASNAVGYDIALTKYGAIRGEGLESLRNFSVGLGAATRGDISLLRTLGKWGIGGINPQDDPINVARAIAQRSKGLSKNERLAMYSEVGFTDAQAMAAEKGDWEMFKKAGSPLSISDTLRQASEKYAETSQSLVSALNELNSKIAPFSNALNGFIKVIPELTLAISTLAGSSTILNLFKKIPNILPGGTKTSKFSKIMQYGKRLMPFALAVGKRGLPIVAAASLGWGLVELKKELEHKNRIAGLSKPDLYYGHIDGIDSILKKTTGLKADNRSSWRVRWDDFWIRNLPDWMLSKENISLPYQAHNNYAQKQSNVINQTININGANAQEIGQEVANATKQAMAY